MLHGYVECHCSHLTNFAVLLGAKIPEKGTAHQLVLKLISYIGIGISLAGTLFTLISYIIFPYVYLDLNEYVPCMISNTSQFVVFAILQRVTLYLATCLCQFLGSENYSLCKVITICKILKYLEFVN